MFLRLAVALSALAVAVHGDFSSLPSQLQPLKQALDGKLGAVDGRSQLPGNSGPIPQAGWGTSVGRGSSSGGTTGSSNGKGSSSSIDAASAQQGPGPAAQGRGDPILNGFDGRGFEYFGTPGAYVNVLSEKTHQVTMRLKEGVMWDHNGTYIEALGVQYQAVQVVVALRGDELTVTLDNATLALSAESGEVEEVLPLERGEMMVLWQSHRPEYGNAVEITTDLLTVLVWETPAGTRDEGGKEQPSYLNFDISLLGPPAHGSMNGLVGETYDFLVDNVTHANDFQFHGKFPEAEYQMDDFFHHAHAQSLFGRSKAERRIALQEENAVYVQFPVRASGSGFLRAHSQAVTAAVDDTQTILARLHKASSLGRKGGQ